MKNLHDKVAVITGGASGLGESIARRLVSEGAKVVISDIDVQRGKTLANELDCSFVKHDVTDEKQWKELVSFIEANYGALHILVNNAGIEGSMECANPESTLLSEWRRIQAVNVEGVFLGCRAAIPSLRRANGGAIINMSSIAAFTPQAEGIAYGASKAAVYHMTKSIAHYCATDGSNIRCNSIHPGIIKTPMVHRILESRAANENKSYEEMEKEYLSYIPQREFQNPEDIAGGVAYLASDDAVHITGTKLIIDGGVTMNDGY